MSKGQHWNLGQETTNKKKKQGETREKRKKRGRVSWALDWKRRG